MYGDNWNAFCKADANAILGRLLAASGGSVELMQRNAWVQQIDLLQSLTLAPTRFAAAKIYFELAVPRLGRRVDVAIVTDEALFILEFKVGEHKYSSAAIDQIFDYALDFKNFHDASHEICIIPILVATDAPDTKVSVPTFSADGLSRPICVSAGRLAEILNVDGSIINGPTIDVTRWERGRYLPTPTIVEAARALYAGHSVAEISRSDAGAINLSQTTAAIDQVINEARRLRRKTICFVTGVPGAGKTLVGLDVATRHLDNKSETYSVFLSGNGPLVAVLREALARDNVARALDKGEIVKKGVARKKVETFIQNVHHFRDEYLRDESAPPEHVVLFDEAQRAWNLEQTSAFMRQKKGRPGFNQSEPEFLISCLERHKDWAVIVCLVGGGQEINTGEGGISEWFAAILNKYPHWEVHLSSHLGTTEYEAGVELRNVLERPNTNLNAALHLSTSMRSFRAESLSRFVQEVLDLEIDAARETLADLEGRYPIFITRNLARAKAWLVQKARGTERYGIVVSSQAERLKPHAIDVRVRTDPIKWFLDGKDDTRSSFYLEDVATEFQVQGLELDWACVVWDGDLRYNADDWSHHQFRGTKWNRINKDERKRYLKNAYRVLMTRARQGMVLVVPEGDDADPTRAKEFYDPTYNYFRGLGIKEL